MVLERMRAGGSPEQLRWDDERIPIGGMVLSGGNQPTIGIFLGAISTLLFAPGVLNEVFLTIQMPHRYAEGTNVVPHIHWAPQNANAGNVVWGFEYQWRNVGAQFANPTTTITVTDATNLVAGEHQVAAFAAVNGSGQLLSSMFCGRIFRDGANAADTYLSNAAMLEFDLHYQVDARGSRQEFIK